MKYLIAAYVFCAVVVCKLTLGICSKPTPTIDKKEKTMKRHDKRFIIEAFGEASKTWFRSGNDGLRGFFATRADAQTALDSGDKSEGTKYRIRQK